MKLILKILITAGALLASSYLIPGIVVDSFYTALIVSIIWGIINITIKPILLLLTFPITLLTLGLSTFIINGFLFWFIATFIQGFNVSGFWVAVLGAFIISLFKWFGDKLIRD